jgi:hypothetical protein
MRYAGWIVLMVLGPSCSKNDCVDEDGCDTAEVDLEPTGPVTVSVKWIESTILEVKIDGMIEGQFGMVEAGLEGLGWYGEDCPDGPYCHRVLEGDNYFTSIQYQDEPWDGTLENDETWLHRDGMQNHVWAVLSHGGKCQTAGGENEELYSYYVDSQACPTN